MPRILFSLVLVSFMARMHSADALAAPSYTKTNSFVELVEPESKCRVVLLGCLHGSLSSSSDVKSMWNDGEHVDSVVLELCASRLADLRRKPSTITTKPGIQRFVDMVARTSAKKGWTTGMAAAVLGGASGLQTALSGFEPGLEFTTALDMASSKGSNVVLADRTVDETLRRLGKLPSVSLSILREGFPKEESKALQTAITGDDALRPHQVNMGNVLTRNRAVREDLIRLTLPPLLFAQVVVAFLHTIMASLDPAAAAQISWWNVMTDLSMAPMDIWSTVGKDFLMEAASSLLVLTLGYVMLALPATRVILCERDDQLTEGIRAACKVTKPGGRVVAVLGLLHVNGVAKRLLSQESEKVMTH